MTQKQREARKSRYCTYRLSDAEIKRRVALVKRVMEKHPNMLRRQQAELAGLTPSQFYKAQRGIAWLGRANYQHEQIARYRIRESYSIDRKCAVCGKMITKAHSWRDDGRGPTHLATCYKF